jgi:hypothetical protein
LVQPQEAHLPLLEIKNPRGKMLEVVELLSRLQADTAQLGLQLLLHRWRHARERAPAFKEPSRRGIDHPSKVWRL